MLKVFKKNNLEKLQAALMRQVELSEKGDFSAYISSNKLTPQEKNAAELINQVIDNYKKVVEYELMRNKIICEALNVAMWNVNVTDDDPTNPNNEFTWSDEFRQMLGFTNEQDFPNLASSWIERLHAEDKSRVLNAFAAHITDRTGKTGYNIMYRLKTKNNEYRHFHAFGSSMRNNEGIALRVVGAIEDITEKIQLQEHLDNEHQELKNNEMRFNLLVKGLELAPWEMTIDPKDPGGKNNKYWWSDEFRHILGFNNKNDFPDEFANFFERIHPDDIELRRTAHTAHVADPTDNTPYDVKYRIKHKNGEYRYIHAMGATLRDSKGLPVKMAGAVKDITKEYEIQKQLELRQEQLEEHNRQIAELMENIREVSENLSIDTKQISDNSQHVARGVSTQADAIEELNESIEVVNLESRTAAQNATKASDLSKSARQSAVSGNEEMQTMLSSMEGIKEASGNISKIIKTIEDIAFQTNLLALNAAVEAARAGDCGRGFAVVAEEVRTLAGRSQTASRETESLITDTIAKVKEGTEIAVKTARTLEAIVSDFEHVSEIVNKIAVGSSKQLSSIEQITAGISQISSITHTNSEASSEMAAASQKLADRSEALMTLFKNV